MIREELFECIGFLLVVGIWYLTLSLPSHITCVKTKLVEFKTKDEHNKSK